VPGNRNIGSTVRRKILVLSLSLATVLAVVAGTFVYTSMHKTVTLSVDGEQQEISTFADDVGAVLADEGIELSGRDVIAPSTDAAVSDGTRIAVRFARPLDLTVDGDEQRYWVTATSVGDALGQLGTRYTGAALSASRSRFIGLDGLDVRVSTPKAITVVSAKGKRRVVSTAPTVADALEQLRNRLRAALAARGLGDTLDRRYRLDTAHMTLVRFAAPLRDAPGFVAALAAARDREFGTSTVGELELVLGDWYHTAAHERCLGRYALHPDAPAPPHG